MHPFLLAELLANDGLVTRRAHPELVQAIKRAHASGELVRVLNGSYLASGVAGSVTHRVRALIDHDPDVVVTGAAAARLTWWPELPVPVIDAYRRGRSAPADGFRWRPRPPVSELFSRGLATAALQVLDLMPDLGPSVVDEALRRRAVSLPALLRALALTPDRPGNGLRRQILADSRDEPWSGAEREFHRVLRAARIAGWRSNYRVRFDDRTYYLDVALPELRLAFEIDGFEHHGTRAAFERDRSRDAHLATHDWQTTRFTAAQVPDSGAVVHAVIAARMTHLRPQCGRPA
jgi:very-short-patch-repair endonuclease